MYENTLYSAIASLSQSLSSQRPSILSQTELEEMSLLPEKIQVWHHVVGNITNVVQHLFKKSLSKIHFFEVFNISRC